MRIKVRNLRWLHENSTDMGDDGIVYNAPVNFFEHVVRCTDWRSMIEEINGESGKVELPLPTPATAEIAFYLIDHVVNARPITIESLDPEFCIPHKVWKAKLWIDIKSYGTFLEPDLDPSDDFIPWNMESSAPISTLRSLAKSVLTGKEEIIYGFPSLIMGNIIASENMSDGGWEDIFVSRQDEKGIITERRFRVMERRR